MIYYGIALLFFCVIVMIVAGNTRDKWEDEERLGFREEEEDAWWRNE